MGFYFFAGAGGDATASINTILGSIKAFLALFAYFGFPPEVFNIPTFETIAITNGSDFIEAKGSVVKYAKTYLNPEDAEYLDNTEVDVEYLFYNWLVNIK